MNVVLDASAAAEIVMGGGQANRFSRFVAEAEVVRAPDLYLCEVSNLFWKYHAMSGMEKGPCELALRQAAQLPDIFVPAVELFEEAFDIACQTHHPGYDLFYLVIARRHASAIITADKKLASLCKKHHLKVL